MFLTDITLRMEIVEIVQSPGIDLIGLGGMGLDGWFEKPKD